MLSILELLDRSPSGLPLKDIAGFTALNKSTAHRLLTHLENTAYLFRDEGGSYMIGPKLVRMGHGTNYQATLRSLSRPVVAHLWRATGETVNLSILDGHEVLYVDVLESPHNFRLVSQVGMRRPLHCTALGKAILSHMNPDRAKECLANARFERTTPKTIINLTQLRKDLSESLARGSSLLVDLYLESHAEAPEQIVLDLDATDIPLYGHQPERFFHDYYGGYCYLPLYIFSGDRLLCARLRPASRDAAAGGFPTVAPHLPHYRRPRPSPAPQL